MATALEDTMTTNCIVCERDNLHVEALPGNAVCAAHFKSALLAMVALDTRSKSACVPLTVQARYVRRVRRDKVGI